MMNQRQIIVNINSRISNNFSLFGFYALGWANSNTDGVSSQPMDDYNLSADYGRASFNVRNRALMSGSVATPKKWGNLRFSPFVTARSGTPFDITVGRDLNGNTYADDRPEFAPAGSCPSTNPDIKCTKYGNFLIPVSNAPYTPIPRNYAVGPPLISVNLRMSRTWGFGEARTSNFSAADRSGGRGGPPGGGGGGGPRGGGGGGGMRGGGGGMRGPGGGDALTNQRFNLILSISARNLLNTTNLGTPVGSLSAANFGESLGLAGGGFGGPGGGGGSSANNRRIDMSIRFSF